MKRAIKECYHNAKNQNTIQFAFLHSILILKTRITMTTIGVQSGIFYLLSYSCPKNTGAGGVYQQCITTTASSNVVMRSEKIIVSDCLLGLYVRHCSSCLLHSIVTALCVCEFFADAPINEQPLISSKRETSFEKNHIQ